MKLRVDVHDIVQRRGKADLGNTGHRWVSAALVSGKALHLNMLKALIRRFRWSSWLLRVWSVLLVLALLQVSSNPEHARFSWLAMLLAIAFWMLDALCLRHRQLLGKLHALVLSEPESEVDLSLDVSRVDSEADAWRSLLISWVPGAYYSALVVGIAVAQFVMHAGSA